MKAFFARLNPLSNVHKLALAALACGVVTLLATPLIGVLDLANIVMLFLLAVLLIATRLGRAAAVLAAFLSVLLFDFFFVPPRFSLAVHDAQYLVTFAVMLAVALVTAHLAAGLRREAQAAAAEEAATRALFDVARELAGALTVAHVAQIARRFLDEAFAVDAALLLPDAAENLQLVPAGADGMQTPGVEKVMARLVFDSGEAVFGDEYAAGGYASACFALKAPTRTRGVLALRPQAAGDDTLHVHRARLEAFASLLAVVVERLHYVEVAHAAQVDRASERLRSSILSALSHDLRTPLTALVGLAESLTLIHPPLPQSALETAQGLRDQAVRMNGLLANLLDMARLHAGQVTLCREWQPVEEVIGAAILLLRPALGARPVRVTIAPKMPLLFLDAVLMERVLGNLIENAAKHAPAASAIDIEVARKNGDALITVSDRGPGFPAGVDKAGLFEMFVRGGGVDKAVNHPGVGLGLAICRAIVDAHGGAIAALDRAGGGASVEVRLPIGNPPPVEDEGAA